MRHKSVIGYCDCCEEEITADMRYVENDEGSIVCGCCLDDHTADDWLEFTKYKWGSSSIPADDY